MAGKQPPPDLLKQLGPLVLASRLKRLSDRLYRDISRLYFQLDINFNANWFPVLYALQHTSPLTVTQIARYLSLSHPAVNQILGKMASEDLVVSKKDSQDERRRLLRLSTKGQQIAQKLQPIWSDIASVNKDTPQFR